VALFAFHPRNGGRDQRSLAGINSGFGVVSGIPDAIIIKGGITYGLTGWSCRNVPLHH
jgi:hypothetical protein